MDYYRLEKRLSRIFSIDIDEDPNSILCASNLEHMDIVALRAITRLAIEIIIRKSSDCKNIIKAGNEAIEKIEKEKNKNNICQIFCDFSDQIVEK